MTVEYSQQEKLDLLDSNYLGDGIIYADLFRDQFVHDNARGQWMFWNDHYWADDKLTTHKKSVEAVAQVYASAFGPLGEDIKDALAAQDSPRAKFLISKKKKLEQRVDRLRSPAGNKACLEFAAGAIEHPLAVTGEEFDHDPDLIGMKNGVLDMRTGDFRPGRQSDYISKTLGVEWPGWDAKCPEFDQFLHEILDDPEKEKLVKDWLGYCLTGHVDIQKIMLWVGAGRNGKSVLVNLIQPLMGDYASPGQSELLLDSGRIRNSASHSADIMMLRGLRSLWFSEVPETAKWDSSRLKTFSGGDVQVARGVSEKMYVRIYPTWKLNIILNDLPRMNGLDRALLDRLLMIEFPFEFVYNPTLPHQRLRDDRIAQRLSATIHNALPMLVDHGMAVRADGLAVPQSCIEFRDEYASENDPISAWIEACVVYSYGETLQFADAYQSFTRWWEETKGKNRRPPSDTWFGRYFPRAKVDGQQVRKHRGATVTYPDIMLITA